jgi:ABC-type branched-subunit amino acid transport system ATPase component
VIEVTGLTKVYGRTRAVDDLSFTVRPGQVTGFLGPNGAGKSTTMRMILGLDRPTAGRATVDGRPYRDQPAPLRARPTSRWSAMPVEDGIAATRRIVAAGARTDHIRPRRVRVRGAARGRQWLPAQGRATGRPALRDATVKTHVGRILTKLDLRDRVQVVVFAYERGVVSRGR